MRLYKFDYLLAVLAGYTMFSGREFLWRLTVDFLIASSVESA
jgi:hypothetical protein